MKRICARIKSGAVKFVRTKAGVYLRKGKDASGIEGAGEEGDERDLEEAGAYRNCLGGRCADCRR